MNGGSHLTLGSHGPNLSGPFYGKPGGKPACHEVIAISSESSMENSFVTGKLAYYTLLSILAVGILMLVLIPIGSTFIYVDYKQQLAQRKSNKNDLCKFKCSFGAECIVDDFTNQPFCKCPLGCTEDYDPVCGSDGKTYTNACYLKFESCNKEQEISIVANSPCDTCERVKCPVPRYQRCEVNDKGSPQCVCAASDSCEHQGGHQPVCASNRKLFGSLCELQRHACFYNLDIVPTNLEFCLEKGSGTVLENSSSGSNPSEHQLTVGVARKCGSQVCTPYEECQSIRSPANDSSVQVCQCARQCPASSPEVNDGPVCGTNNQNYANICELRRDACQRQVELKVLHQGHCGTCRQQCHHYATCQKNEELGIMECVCPQVCIRADNPELSAVCGSNGVTYENECELAVASCRLQQRITVRFNGSCDLCHNVVCPYGATCVDGECVCAENCPNQEPEPLCANDGNTYSNECEMKRAACNSKKELIAFFYGKCEENKETYLEDSAALSTDAESSSLVTLTNAAVQSECQHLLKTCQQAQREHGYVYICEDQMFHSKCEMIEFKCRNANNQLKCSKYCHCNQHGIRADSLRPCNPLTGQCDCKADGVGGLKCDKCLSKFWNFQHLIDNPASSGCLPCKCNRIGSISGDCDKATGKCRCRPGVSGPKCDQCPPHWHLADHGLCVPDSGHSCQRLKCQYGAVCRQNGTRAECSCQLNCNIRLIQSAATPVCASDGSRHPSLCHFREHMCRLQRRIHVVKNCSSSTDRLHLP